MANKKYKYEAVNIVNKVFAAHPEYTHGIVERSSDLEHSQKSYTWIGVWEELAEEANAALVAAGFKPGYKYGYRNYFVITFDVPRPTKGPGIRQIDAGINRVADVMAWMQTRNFPKEVLDHLDEAIIQISKIEH